MLPWQLQRYKVVHFPDHGVPRGAWGRSLVTVHDLSFLINPESHSPSSCAYYGAAVRTLRRAGHVITVSDYVREQVLTRGLAEPARVTVVYEAPALRANGDTATPTPPAGRPYALTVGTVQPRKNIARLAEGFVRGCAADDLELLVVGGLGWRGLEIVRAVRTLPGAERVRFVGRVTDATLGRLLAGAEFLVMASLDEGFGLPLLEAMSRGVPCLAARAGALPEIGADAVLYADPTDVHAIAAGIAQLASSADLRHQLGERGRLRARAFDWRRAAVATAALYRQLL